MELYKGIEIDDKVTLGVMRKIKQTFGSELHQLKTVEIIQDSEKVIDFIKCFLNMSNDDADKKIACIPVDGLTSIVKKINIAMCAGDPEVGNIQEQSGNARTRASKKL